MSFPPPGDLPDPGIETTPHVSPALQVDSLLSELTGSLSIYLYTRMYVYIHTIYVLLYYT